MLDQGGPVHLYATTPLAPPLPFSHHYHHLPSPSLFPPPLPSTFGAAQLVARQLEIDSLKAAVRHAEEDADAVLAACEREHEASALRTAKAIKLAMHNYVSRAVMLCVWDRVCALFVVCGACAWCCAEWLIFGARFALLLLLLLLVLVAVLVTGEAIGKDIPKAA